jgi:hypothetical protein
LPDAGWLESPSTVKALINGQQQEIELLRGLHTSLAIELTNLWRGWIGLSVAFGKRLEIKEASAVDQVPEQRHEQQEPLRLEHSRPVAATGNRLEEADQQFRYGWKDCGGGGVGGWAGEIPLSKSNADILPLEARI